MCVYIYIHTLLYFPKLKKLKTISNRKIKLIVVARFEPLDLLVLRLVRFNVTLMSLANIRLAPVSLADVHSTFGDLRLALSSPDLVSSSSDLLY